MVFPIIIQSFSALSSQSFTHLSLSSSLYSASFCSFVFLLFFVPLFLFFSFFFQRSPISSCVSSSFPPLLSNLSFLGRYLFLTLCFFHFSFNASSSCFSFPCHSSFFLFNFLSLFFFLFFSPLYSLLILNGSSLLSLLLPVLSPYFIIPFGSSAC